MWPNTKSGQFVVDIRNHLICYHPKQIIDFVANKHCTSHMFSQTKLPLLLPNSISRQKGLESYHWLGCNARPSAKFYLRFFCVKSSNPTKTSQIVPRSVPCCVQLTVNVYTCNFAIVYKHKNNYFAIYLFRVVVFEWIRHIHSLWPLRF